MSASEVHTLDEEDRQRVAAEVLELGETLFDLALEHTAWQDHHGGDNPTVGKEHISAELRVAKDEFFRALRLLHGL